MSIRSEGFSKPEYVSTIELFKHDTHAQDAMNGRLPPDAYGNQIPPDAIWTRVDRSLVSAELLHQAGVRYEARPKYVAVLGILTKAQILQLAELSTEARLSRRQQRVTESPSRDQTASWLREHRDDCEECEPPMGGSGNKSAHEYPDRQGDKRGKRYLRKEEGRTPETSSRHRHRHRHYNRKDRRVADVTSTSVHSKRKSVIAFQTLSIVGSVASVVSLAKDFIK